MLVVSPLIYGGVMTDGNPNEQAGTHAYPARNERGASKDWPVMHHRVAPELKAIVERTAKRLGCSQAVAINQILAHLELTFDGVPMWVETEQPEEDRPPLFAAS